MLDGVRPRVKPNPKSLGEISPQNVGRITPQNVAGISPQNVGRITPQSGVNTAKQKGKTCRNLTATDEPPTGTNPSANNQVGRRLAADASPPIF